MYTNWRFEVLLFHTVDEILLQITHVQNHKLLSVWFGWKPSSGLAQSLTVKVPSANKFHFHHIPFLLLFCHVIQEFIFDNFSLFSNHFRMSQVQTTQSLLKEYQKRLREDMNSLRDNFQAIILAAKGDEKLTDKLQLSHTTSAIYDKCQIQGKKFLNFQK